MREFEENFIHHGDCITQLKLVAAESVALAFADPPFNIGYQYDVYHDRQAAATYLEWTRQWTAAVVRTLTPTGTFWVAIGDEYAAEMKIILQNHGLICRNWVIWYYTFGVHCARKLSRSHVHLFYFVKDGGNFTFNADAIRVPSARMTTYRDKRAHPKGRLPDDTWILRPQDLPDGWEGTDDTWYFPRVAGTFKERRGFHGCQMPEQVLGRIVRLCSQPGDRVLDPFAGSGTTLAVAKKLARQWLGFDVSEEYVAQARARLNAISVGDPLDGTADPVLSAPRTATPRHG